MDDAEVSAFRRGALYLSCPQIELTDNEGNFHCRGPGYIAQNDTRELHVTVFFKRENSHDGRLFTHVKPGELYGARHSLQLTAVDVKGRAWTGKSVGSIDACVHFDYPHCSATARFYEICSTNAFPSSVKNATMEMRTFSKFRFPRNETLKTVTTIGDALQVDQSHDSAAQFSFGKFRFLIFEDRDQVLLQVNSDDQQFDPFFEVRIVEALLFSIGVSVIWEIVGRSEGHIATLILRSSVPAGLEFRYTPIGVRTHDFESKHWKMFELYWNFIASHTGPLFHPLSAQLHLIHAASGDSIQGSALLRAVAVESALKCCFNEFDNQRNESVAIRSLVAHVGKWAFAEGQRCETHNDSEMPIENIKTRASAALSHLNVRSAADRLYALADKNAISKDLIPIWKKIRRSFTHGDWKGMDDLQTLHDNSGSMLVLLYQLILHKIGYEGEQTDWGRTGWPTIAYPPQGAGDGQ